MPDDVRISEWSLTASAGTTAVLQFTSPDALTSLAVYTGGTVTDVDDLTGATAYNGVLSGGNLVATVSLSVPTGASVPMRLVVNGTVQTVGRLRPSTHGTEDPDNTITLTPGTLEFDLTILGVGAPTDVGYLVTAASGNLSNEVVVGTSPGGELGGTWASPTVDATHSGSSHAGVQAAAEATAAAALASHAADTTAIHGITDTSALETTTGAQAKADAKVDDTAYDATSWNGVTGTAPSKNAVRDAVEGLSLTYVAQAGHAANSLPVSAAGSLADLSMGASTILARLAAGGIVAATPAQLRTLLNVEDGATADQTAAELLTALLTVDGPGSGLNADLFDGANLSTDGTLAANSDTKVPTEKAVKAYLDAHANDLTLHSSGQRLGRVTYDANIAVVATAAGTALPSLGSLTPADSGGRPVTIGFRSWGVLASPAHARLRLLRDGVTLRTWSFGPVAAAFNIPINFEVDTDAVDGTDVFTIQGWFTGGGAAAFSVFGAATELTELLAYAR